MVSLTRRNSLAAENEALRRGEDPPVTDVPSSALNYDLSSNPAAGMSSTPSSGLAASPTEVKPRAQPRRSKKTAATPPEPFASENAQLPIPVLPPPPPPPPLERPASSLDLLARASQAPDSTLPLPPELSVPLPTNFDEATFDFDAPFDFSETMPLPPLFSSLAEEFELMGSLGGGGGVSGATLPATANPATGMDAPGSDGDVNDVCPNEEDEPPLLPGNRIPCDKPECDFTAVSCALPMPWRPPTVAGDDKNLWVAQKCWAKLCSHPLFPLCDSVSCPAERMPFTEGAVLITDRVLQDELCQLLRDKTRCSDDGRLVCHKSDVCDIFRSLPKRAKIRQQTLSMA